MRTTKINYNWIINLILYNLDDAFINVSAVCRRCEPLTKTLNASNGVSQTASIAPIIVFV
jgi:hypothetical protein